jgi:RimJ/RimL family protein N-acetyltransferase
VVDHFIHDGLSLRVPTVKDIDRIQELRNDQGTWIHLTDPRPLGPGDQKKWVDSLSMRSGRFYFVASTPEHQFLGIVRMDEFDTLNRSIRVGADIAPELRGKGFGIRLYGTIKRYCFDFMNVHRVWLAVLETNGHAMRLYEKQGFKTEGRYRSAVYRDGKYVDYVLMSILEHEYRYAERRGS